MHNMKDLRVLYIEDLFCTPEKSGKLKMTNTSKIRSEILYVTQRASKLSEQLIKRFVSRLETQIKRTEKMVQRGSNGRKQR